MKNIPLNQNKIKDLITNRQNHRFEDQLMESRRIVSEIETIDSRAAFRQVQNRIQKEKRSVQVLSIAMRVAAVLFIPLLLASSWLFYKQLNQDKASRFAIQEITSPPGVRSPVVLPDGSKVWLNAESTIRFRIPFSSECRNVDLMGEAFFEVVKNPKQPFFVQSGNVKVKVLGTRFNYKAFSDDKNIEVMLEEGKIALTIKTGADKMDAVLNPGDHEIIEKETGETIIRNENISKYIAWHMGKLVFDNTSMSEVALMLERWFGVDVIVQDSEILNYRFTTTFENESLPQVIELLGLSSPIRIKYFPSAIGKDNQTVIKSKVIIQKQ